MPLHSSHICFLKISKFWPEMSFQPPIACSLEKQKPEGRSLLPTTRGLRGFTECRIFSAKIVTFPGKSRQLVIFHVTRLSQSDDFSWSLPHEVRTQGLLGLWVLCRDGCGLQTSPSLKHALGGVAAVEGSREPLFGRSFPQAGPSGLPLKYSFSLESFSGMNS